MALLTRLLESNTRLWGLTITDAVIELVNVNKRTPFGYTTVRSLDFTSMAGSLDSWQALAEDMARLEVTDSYNEDYTITLTDSQGRTNATVVYDVTETRITLPLNGSGFDRLSDASMPNAMQIYTALASSGLFAVYPSDSDVFLAIGYGEVAYGPGNEFPQTMYLSVVMLRDTLHLPGTGLVVKPSKAFTAAPVGEQYMQLNSVLWGETWHAQFLALVNEQREFMGVAPYKLPTAQVYTDYLDIAELHTRNMVDTRTWAHDNEVYPSGNRSFEERVLLLGKPSGENILLTDVSGRYDPAVPYRESGIYRIGEIDTTKTILNDATMITPYEAFSSWWNSGGHRQNMLRDWGSETVYSFMAIADGPWATDPGSMGSADPNINLYFTNVFSVLESIVAERTLFMDYQIVGANILTQALTFRLDALTKVRAAHQAVHSLRIAAMFILQLIIIQILLMQEI